MPKFLDRRLPLQTLLAALGAGHRVTLVDVGAIGGLKGRWEALAGRVDSIGFDPREPGDKPVEVSSGVIYPFAVGPKTMSETLYITRMGNMSSTLRPNAAALRRFRGRGRQGAVVGEEKLEVRSIDSILEGRTVDAIKVDTQGSELGILTGAEATLSDVLVAEIEVSFFERFEGQPLFGDVAAYLATRGFDFIELYQRRWYRRSSSRDIRPVGLGELGRAGQLAYADAIFFATDERLAQLIDSAPPERRGGKVAGAILLYLVYGKVDAASAVFDTHRQHLPSPDADAFEQLFATYMAVVGGIANEDGDAGDA